MGSEDPRARIRIRDAALRLFAERGIEAASIRDIAKAAEVSSGLVRHHFGSKEALRDACDRHALDRLMTIKEQAVSGGWDDDPAFAPQIHPTVMLMQQYLVRSAADGSEAANAMFEDMVRLAEQWLARSGITSTDRRAHAAVLSAMNLGLFLLLDQVSRTLGVDVRTPEGHLRMTRGLLDVHSHALLGPERTGEHVPSSTRPTGMSPTQSRRSPASASAEESGDA